MKWPTLVEEVDGVWLAVYDYEWLKAVVIFWSVAYYMCLVRFCIHDVRYCAMPSLLALSKQIGHDEVVTIRGDLSSSTNTAESEHIVLDP